MAYAVTPVSRPIYRLCPTITRRRRGQSSDAVVQLRTLRFAKTSHAHGCSAGGPPSSRSTVPARTARGVARRDDPVPSLPPRDRASGSYHQGVELLLVQVSVLLLVQQARKARLELELVGYPAV